MNNLMNSKRSIVIISIIIILVIALGLMFWGYKIGFKKGLDTKSSITNKYQEEQKTTNNEQSLTNTKTNGSLNALTTPPISPPNEAYVGEFKTGAEIRKMIIESNGSIEGLEDISDKQLLQMYYESLKNNQ